MATIPRDSGEPEGRPFSMNVGCSNVDSVAAQNDLLISTASQWRIGQLHEGSPDTTLVRTESRGLSQRREACSPHGIVQGSGERCIAYLILGNYGGTMKGAVLRPYSVFSSHCSYLLSLDEKLIFLLIIRQKSRDPRRLMCVKI